MGYRGPTTHLSEQERRRVPVVTRGPCPKGRRGPGEGRRSSTERRRWTLSGGGYGGGGRGTLLKVPGGRRSGARETTKAPVGPDLPHGPYDESAEPAGGWGVVGRGPKVLL